MKILSKDEAVKLLKKDVKAFNEYRQELYEKGIFDIDLSGVDFEGADLRDANLRRSDLRDADLRDADFQGADFRRSDLRRSDLRRADLRRADLRRVDFEGADFEGADLQGANLLRADLLRAGLKNIKGKHIFKTTGNGSEGREIWYIAEDDYIKAGCWDGTLEEFEKRVEEVYKDNEDLKESYIDVIDYYKKKRKK